MQATTHYQDPDVLAKISAGLGEPMSGIDTSSLAEEARLETRGW